MNVGGSNSGVLRFSFVHFSCSLARSFIVRLSVCPFVRFVDSVFPPFPALVRLIRRCKKRQPKTMLPLQSANVDPRQIATLSTITLSPPLDPAVSRNP
ncbi:uncharacterized protein YALI1_F15843g [Yarrowia lipolytica]|uniref:Uncharacterized protein n=1 Tax=Yarrowia lipolytica TaxID=4952 RepID=A0A1D8NN41_YARLL|nr:hypothetical protein YALI1_F15843g [Yarrowia lipolytica]